MGDWVTLISTLGFPIVACCAMGWYTYYNTNKHSEEIERINQQHYSEMEKVTEALNNNTLAIQKLCNKLGG